MNDALDLGSRIGTIPYQVNPDLKPGTIEHWLKGTPREFFVVDSIDTLKAAISAANRAGV